MLCWRPEKATGTWLGKAQLIIDAADVCCANAGMFDKFVYFRSVQESDWPSRPVRSYLLLDRQSINK